MSIVNKSTNTTTAKTENVQNTEKTTSHFNEAVNTAKDTTPSSEKTNSTPETTEKSANTPQASQAENTEQSSAPTTEIVDISDPKNPGEKIFCIKGYVNESGIDAIFSGLTGSIFKNHPELKGLKQPVNI